MARKKNERHGETKKTGERSPEYAVWSSMRQRCGNPNDAAFKDYGGRGIAVCARWQESYAAFLEDVGRRPSPDHQINRINNDGPYAPDNVEWALPAEQSRNKRNNHFITAFGRTRPVVDWATALKAHPGSIIARIERGWPPEDAVSVPTDAHTVHAITARGETKSLAAWAAASGHSVTTISHRLLTRGWPPEEAIFTPPGACGTGRPRTRTLTASGETLSLEEWVTRTGLKRSTIEMRLRRGLSEADALRPTSAASARASPRLTS